MTTIPRVATRDASAQHLRWARLVVLAVLLALRLAHLVFAARSPLSYQLGPDEDYYLGFARDVAFGSCGMGERYAFMDPLYGYVLGAVLRTSGDTVFVHYLLQVAIDCLCACGLLRLGRLARQPWVGVGAAAIFAVLGPAIAFDAMLLKATFVACYCCWWMVLAWQATQSERAVRWLALGLYCGLGVALRANLVLFVPLALLVVANLHGEGWRRPGRMAARRSAWLLAGLALPLLLLAARNHAISGRASPLPTNGGVVLHQLYNPENPRSLSGVPSFVRYGHPAEILRAYTAEAMRRRGQAMTPLEVDHYWRTEALSYLRAHPLQSLGNGLRKLAEASAYPEVPNTRAYPDEQRFSPILRWLPQPFGWLFAFGLPGLAWLAWRDRRALVLWMPVAVGMATIAVFFAEDRFRFGFIAPFVFGSVAWVAAVLRTARARRWGKTAAMLGASALLGVWSVVMAQRIPPVTSDWQRIATGYFRMGDVGALRAHLQQVAHDDPDAVGLHEFRGMLALTERRHALAVDELGKALAQRQDRHEVWHNYATAVAALGYRDEALVAELRAIALAPLPEYQAQAGVLLEQLGRVDEARAVYGALAADASAARWQAFARTRLDALDSPGRR